MKTAGAICFRSRTRYYDVIPMTDDEHPVERVVQRWTQHGAAPRRFSNLQEQLIGLLGPDAQRPVLELEELRNAVAAEREEAYFDVGVGYGIERQTSTSAKAPPEDLADCRKAGRSGPPERRAREPRATRSSARARRGASRIRHVARGVPRERQKDALRCGPFGRAT